MLKDKSRLIEELQWMNWKSFMLVWLTAMVGAILIATFAGTGIGFFVGIAAYLICHVWLQRLMARKLADKIMKAHKEDYTVYVETSLKAKR